MTYLETCVYNLSTLSPIHIRAGRLEEYGEGFIRVGDNVYIVDTPKLQAEILNFGQLNAVNQYIETFSNPESDTTVTEFLREIGYDYRTNIHKISKGIVRLPRGNRFIQTGFGEYYIPGSSIKGAIKTAVFYHVMKSILNHDPAFLDTFVDGKIAEYLTNPSKDKRQRFAEDLLEQAFQSSHPREHFPNQERIDELSGPFTDIFRAIKIKDAIIKESSDLQRENILITTLNDGYQVDRKWMVRNVECFYGETSIEISIDHEILKSFERSGVVPPFSDLSSLIDLCYDFSQTLWGAEQRFLGTYAGGKNVDLTEINAFYNNLDNQKAATLRCGWGTGMLGTTISLLLQESNRVYLRNEVISEGRHRRPRPAPKSRRYVVLEDGQLEYPLGWIELYI